MRIKKYGLGSIIYTPYISNPAQPGSLTQKSDPSNEGSSKMQEKISSEIISAIKEEGLPSDVDSFLMSANQFLSGSQDVLGMSSGNPAAYDMSHLIQLQSQANKIRHNKELYDVSVKRMEAEDSWSEAAVSNRGELYAYSEEGMQKISPEEYYNNKDKYTILTNSELMSLRASNTEFSYDSTILNDMVNSVGMESIVNHVKQIITSFGTNSSDAYIGKNKGEIQKGLELIAMGPEGIYKMNQSHQGYNPNDEDSINIALSYLYKNLPTNMKNALLAKSTAEGIDPNDPDSRLELLKYALIQHTDHKTTVDYDKQATDAMFTRGSGGGSPSGKTVEQTPLEMMMTGAGVDTRRANINPDKDGTALTIYAQDYGTPQTRTGDNISQGSLTHVLNEANYGAAVDRSSIYFGDQKVDDPNTVIWDGVSSTQRTILPIDMKVYQETGQLKPDIDAQKKFDEFQKFIINNPDMTQLEVRQKLDSLDLQNVVVKRNEQTGEPEYVFHPNATKVFLVLNGFSSDEYLNKDGSSNMLHEISSREESRYEDEFDLYANFSDGNRSDNNRSPLNYESTGWFSETMYKGSIFMPVVDPVIGTVQSNNQLQPQENYFNIGQQAEARRQRQQMVTNLDDLNNL